MKNSKNYEFTEVMLDKDFEIVHNREYLEKPQMDREFHFHDFYEIFLFKEGVITIYIEENAYRLLPGDLLIMPPGVMHSKSIDDSTMPYERTVIYINKSVLVALGDEESDFLTTFRRMEESNKLMIHFDQDTQEELQLLIKQLLSEFQKKETGYSLMKKAYMTELLVRINRQSKKAEQIPVSVKTSSIIPSIIAYINENLTRQLTLDELSEMFFISKYHLIREFSKYTGTTVHNYIITKRIVFVKTLLDQGCSNIEASMRAGFSDYSVFYKAFVKRMGMTPKEYMQFIND